MAHTRSTFLGWAAVIILGGGAYLARDTILQGLGFGGTTTPAKAATSKASSQIVTLSAKQAEAIKVEPVRERVFPIEKDAVGSIDFNEDMTLQVFSQYQGRIIDLFAKIGDEVKKGQTLFTIDSPDLVQAASTLISTAGVLELTTRNLLRLRDRVKTKAAAQKDLEQAISDQQAAEG